MLHSTAPALPCAKNAGLQGKPALPTCEGCSVKTDQSTDVVQTRIAVICSTIAIGLEAVHMDQSKLVVYSGCKFYIAQRFSGARLKKELEWVVKWVKNGVRMARLFRVRLGEE